jgi:hypothetical protein
MWESSHNLLELRGEPQYDRKGEGLISTLWDSDQKQHYIAERAAEINVAV